MDKAQAHVLITGRVQGVCYRAYTCEEAKKLGLTGWVKNLPDGRVEAVFEGNKNLLEQMIRWCHGGPPAAKVASVETVWSPYRGDFQNFRIL